MLQKLGIGTDTVRGIIAMLLVIGVLVYPLVGVAIPPEILAMAALVIGYYFARRANGDHAPVK